jgi:hypothetical protein
MVDGVPSITATIETNAMCVFSALKQMMSYFSFALISVLKSDNNVSNQASSFYLNLYQYLNIGIELMQLKSAIHSP